MPLEIFRSWKLEKRLCKARRSRYRLYVAGSVASSDPCLALSRLWLLYSGLAGRSPTRTAADLLGSWALVHVRTSGMAARLLDEFIVGVVHS